MWSRLLTKFSSKSIATTGLWKPLCIPNLMSIASGTLTYDEYTFTHSYSHTQSVLWHCWLDDRKDIWPVKSLVLVCWWRRFDWSFAHVVTLIVTTTTPWKFPPSYLAPMKSRMKTFCYWLTLVHLEEWLLKRRKRQTDISTCMVTTH